MAQLSALFQQKSVFKAKFDGKSETFGAFFITVLLLYEAQLILR